MKSISIAIPTWESYGRGEEFLDDLLRTIEIQTFKDFEVVISDHSVDDKILSKVNQFKNKFEIHYIKNENNRGNSPSNLNNAINNCSGQIIKIMFQDDFFYDDESLEKINDSLVDSDKMWLLNACNHTMDDGRTFYWDFYPRFNVNLLSGVNTISSPSVVAFKNTVKTRFDENLVYLMDVDFYYAVRDTYGDPIFYDDILISNRFPHTNSITNNIKDKSLVMEQEAQYCHKKYEVT
jgi:glycosyltransferase involved in cell wall biosynthesis